MINATVYVSLKLSSGHYACPTCQTSMMDMNQLWEYLDAEVSATPMPKEYENYIVDILCKDCHKVGLGIVRLCLDLKLHDIIPTCRNRPSNST